MDLAKRKRSALRVTITKSKTAVENMDSMSDAEKQVLINKLKNIEVEIKELNESIVNEMWAKSEKSDKSDVDVELQKIEEYTDCLTLSLVLLEESRKSTVLGPRLQNQDETRSILKQPVAPFPTFYSREGENLDKFFKHFEATIAKFNYSDWDKFELLKQHVKGRAAILISSLEYDQQSYLQAKQLLNTALASPTTQKFNICKQMSEIELKANTDPFEYMSSMKNIIETSKNLNMSLEDVFQYFFWNGLNNSFRKQLTLITNQSKPSLSLILDNYFDASERYLSENKVEKLESKNKNSYVNFNFRPKKESEKPNFTNNYAANVKFDAKASNIKSTIKPCILCCKISSSNNTEHSINNCPRFTTPKEKVAKLKELKACTKCAMTSHGTFDCKFNFFSKCSKCNGYHFSYLCLTEKHSIKSNENKSKTLNQSSKKTKNEVDSGLVYLETKNSVSASEVILPTFTCKIKNKLVRCLRDSGCQSNFVTESLVKQLNMNVLREDYKIKVNGFNSSKVYDAKLVEMNVELGKDRYKIEAICIPQISTKMQLSGLGELVDSLQMSGIKLADQKLVTDSDVIDNIEVILGSGAAHCLGENLKIIENGPVVYYKTKLGVMLVGDVKQLLKEVRAGKLLQDDPKTEETEVNFSILNENGEINEKELGRATEEILNINYYQNESYDRMEKEEMTTEVNKKIVKHVLERADRLEDGRLRLNLMWNGRVAHLLGHNKFLAEKILNSSVKKLNKQPEKLEMVDAVFKEQEEMGIIEKIPNLNNFLEEHPEASFLAHMPIFKLQRQTTKCRVVYLSNLSEKNGRSISHNQAMWAGPCLNRKLSTALLLLRFDKFLFCYDLKKAFNQIHLNEVDQNRLLFLWYKNLGKQNQEMIAYKNVRLSFGLKCSPALLMLALYKILMMDTDTDSDSLKTLKKSLYDMIYMDNGAYTANTESEVQEAYKQLATIFEPYKFEVQQCISNALNLQKFIDEKEEEETPEVVKLLGLDWDRSQDNLMVRKLELNEEAKTKRTILSTIASNFDLFNFAGPLLNRSRLFMHKLQCNTTLGI